MPITKRRKTDQGEGNSGEKERNSSVTADIKDVVTTDKHAKCDAKSEIKDAKQKQGKEDTSLQLTEESVKISRPGAVTRSRVVRKPKRNFSPPPSPTKKAAKETKTSTPETKQKRQWELWSVDDKDAFFEGLFEVGKDFEAIQSFVAQKGKKKGINPSLVKNKDQVRHFYYRTWHKISKFITLAPEVKKESLELYGLINYGALRKKIKGLDDKTGAKLNDLVHNGFTTVKIRGKNLRIKTPICLALKKLNNIDTTENRCNPADRIPNKIQVEMSPKTNAAWGRVQELAFNPRLKLMLKPNRTLSSVLTYLSQKWKSQRSRLRENVSGEETEAAHVLTVYPHPDSDITPLTLQATKEPKINITFSDYRENLLNSPSISREKKGETTKTISTVFSENSRSVDFMDPKTALFESPKSRLNTKDMKLGSTPTSSCSAGPFSVDVAFLSEGENAMFPDTPLSKADSKSTENLTETESNDGSPPRKKHLSGGNESEVARTTSSDNEEKCLDSEKEEQEAANIKEALENGWNSTSSENLTIAQLYLMFGKDQKIKLEYDFCKVTTVEDIVKSQLTNTLRRLVHLAVMEMTDVKVTGSSSTSSSTSPCQSCGVARSKVTKGCAKGQRGSAKNPLSSKAADGLVDVGTQTTFKFKEPSNSSQERKEAVFKIPVMGASFLQKNTAPPGSISANRTLSQTLNALAPGYRNGRKIQQIKRKPMVVQRTILPKAPNLYTLVHPPGQTLNSVINVPSTVPVFTNPSAQPVVHNTPSHTQHPTITLNPSQLNMQSPTQTITMGPEQLQSHSVNPGQTITIGPGQLQSQIVTSGLSRTITMGPEQLQSPMVTAGLTKTITMGPEQLTQTSGALTTITLGPEQLQSLSQGSNQLRTITIGPDQLPVHINTSQIPTVPPDKLVSSTVTVYTTSMATNHVDVVMTASTSQGTMSPPSISNLLDMSFSNFGPPGGDGEKLFDIALSAGSTFEPTIIDESANKELPVLSTNSVCKQTSTPIRSSNSQTWTLHGEVGDLSFMSLLNESAKVEHVPQTTVLQPQTLFFENSRDSSIMGKFDVDTLMNESSMDFAAKFADLQALTQEDSMDSLKKNVSNG